MQYHTKTHLLLIKFSKVIDDDGYGHGYHQHTANTTDASDQLSPSSFGVNVSEADRRHGDSRPPKRLWNALKHLSVGIFLGEISKAGKNDDSDRDEADK